MSIKLLIVKTHTSTKSPWIEKYKVEQKCNDFIIMKESSVHFNIWERRV